MKFWSREMSVTKF